MESQLYDGIIYSQGPQGNGPNQPNNSAVGGRPPFGPPPFGPPPGGNIRNRPPPPPNFEPQRGQPQGFQGGPPQGFPGQYNKGGPGLGSGPYGPGPPYGPPPHGPPQHGPPPHGPPPRPQFQGPGSSQASSTAGYGPIVQNQTGGPNSINQRFQGPGFGPPGQNLQAAQRGGNQNNLGPNSAPQNPGYERHRFDQLGAGRDAQNPGSGPYSGPPGDSFRRGPQGSDQSGGPWYGNQNEANPHLGDSGGGGRRGGFWQGPNDGPQPSTFPQGNPREQQQGHGAEYSTRDVDYRDTDSQSSRYSSRRSDSDDRSWKGSDRDRRVEERGESPQRRRREDPGCRSRSRERERERDRFVMHLSMVFFLTHLKCMYTWSDTELILVILTNMHSQTI